MYGVMCRGACSDSDEMSNCVTNLASFSVCFGVCFFLFCFFTMHTQELHIKIQLERLAIVCPLSLSYVNLFQRRGL